MPGEPASLDKATGEYRRVMAKQSPQSFKKRQKEYERTEKAKKKMAKRQSKKDRTEETGIPEQP
jgi:hypothetical protein